MKHVFHTHIHAFKISALKCEAKATNPGASLSKC